MIVYTNEVVYIPKGSINRIITHLQEKNYNVCKLDSFILRFVGAPQSGWIFIGSKKLRRGDFLYKLTRAKAPLVSVTLIPGETTYIFLDELSKKLRLDKAKLQRAYDALAPYPEGAFVPETYKLPYGIKEQMAIYLLLRNSDKKFSEYAHKIFGKYDRKKWLRYLIVASIVQKEAASKEEMPLVASVIYNRLKKGMPLQMDGTLNYGKYSHIKITAKRVRTDVSKFNTYKYRGLPPYPVCNPSLDAIKAAIFPTKTSYLYFVKLHNGKHAFSKSYREHLRYIKKSYEK